MAALKASTMDDPTDPALMMFDVVVDESVTRLGLRYVFFGELWDCVSVYAFLVGTR